ncbi:MAG TPA: hypothetical protein VGI28_04090, partial [Stellaceae bacterium]
VLLLAQRRSTRSLLPLFNKFPSLFCFERFQPTGDPGGAQVAGMTIPEHGRTRIALQTTQMGVIQIDGIESLPQPQRGLRLSCIGGALEKKTCRGDIARCE